MLLLPLLFACEEAPSDTQDTASEPTYNHWLDGERAQITLQDPLGGDAQTVQADRLVVFLPLGDDEALPELLAAFELEGRTAVLQGEAGDAEGNLDLLDALALSWGDQDCTQLGDACATDDQPSELALSPLSELTRFTVTVGSEAQPKDGPKKPVRIMKRLDQTTPLLMSGDDGDGDITSAGVARVLVYLDDDPVAHVGPYPAWEEGLVRLSEGPPPNGVSAVRVPGGMLLSLEWGGPDPTPDAWDEIVDAWHTPTDAELAWMAAQEPQGATLPETFKGEAIDGLGLGATSEEALVLSGHLYQEGHEALGWPATMGITREEAAEGTLLEVRGQDCGAACYRVGAFQDGDDIVLRKRPGGTRYKTTVADGVAAGAAGGIAGGAGGGNMVLAQGDDTMTLAYGPEGLEVTFDSPDGKCIAGIWQDDQLAFETRVECGVAYPVDAGLPVGLASDFDGDVYAAAVMF